MKLKWTTNQRNVPTAKCGRTTVQIRNLYGKPHHTEVAYKFQIMNFSQWVEGRRTYKTINAAKAAVERFLSALRREQK